MIQENTQSRTSVQSIVHRPILFSGPMVRALLEGRKTQTRREVKAINHDAFEAFTAADPSGFWGFDAKNEPVLCVHSPYGEIGDRLWVREKCRVASATGGANAWYSIDYAAGGSKAEKGELPGKWFPSQSRNADESLRWQPSIHMPRWASRITLEITDLRIERVQSISREDAIDEGIFLNERDWWDAGNGLVGQMTPEVAFRELWACINGHDAWVSNPWVWVVEFKVV